MALTSAAINLGKSDDQVSSKSVQYLIMEQKWRLPEALLSGTEGMRNLRETYLPKNPLESTKNYDLRLLKTFLYNAFGDTVQKLSDKPFQKPVVLQDEDKLPEELKSIEFNVDFSGRDLTDFAKDLIEDATIYGKTHIIVDFPKTGGAATLKEQRDRAARPSFIHVTARDLIGWQIEDNEDGVPELTQIRYCESTVEADGLYGDKLVTRIRVWMKNEWELWEQQTIKKGNEVKNSWNKVDEGTNSLGYIPLITMYTKREGLLISGVPLDDLAWVNLEHWQSSSEQRNMLHVVRIATLFAKGFKKEEIEKGITISANGMVATENTDADLKWIEHKGDALKAGALDLANLESRMEVLGLQPLIQKSAASTATGVAVSEGRANSKIQSWVRVLQGSLLKAYVVAADWLGKADQMPEGFRVNVFSDFGVSLRDEAELKVLFDSRIADEIDHTTFINEMKRRGVLNEAVDAEKIQDELDDELENELKNNDKDFLNDEETEEEKIARELKEKEDLDSGDE